MFAVSFVPEPLASLPKSKAFHAHEKKASETLGDSLSFLVLLIGFEPTLLRFKRALPSPLGDRSMGYIQLLKCNFYVLADAGGFGPPTLALTERRSAVELRTNISQSLYIISHFSFFVKRQFLML